MQDARQLHMLCMSQQCNVYAIEVPGPSVKKASHIPFMPALAVLNPQLVQC